MRGATRPASAALSRSSFSLRPRSTSSSSPTASPQGLATFGSRTQSPSTTRRSASFGIHSPSPHHRGTGGYRIPVERIRDERSGGARAGFDGGVGVLSRDTLIPLRVPDGDDDDGDRGAGVVGIDPIPTAFAGLPVVPLLPPRTVRMYSSQSWRGRDDGRIYRSYLASAITRAALVRNLSTTATPSSGGRGKDDDEAGKSSGRDAPVEPEGKKSVGEKFISEERRATMKASAVRHGLRARELWQHYGVVFLGTYLTVYCATLGLLFVGVNWGWMDASTITFGGEEGVAAVGGGADDSAGVMDGDGGDGGGGDAEGGEQTGKRASKSANAVIQFLERFEYTQKWAEKAAKNPNYINLGIAWVATKFTEPVRLGVTIAVTPRVARFFGRGPPPKKGKDGDDNADKNKG